ncbi:LIM and SH3 domain Lasp [Brachionus plicatilis]|uniref:LIM and SH3 domain Lasp n=1 Tax=Brachionus plicatilis TaxID=10195 RepID=A0A3M7QUP4_BRAPC|nr:LIM and SH3 domain Lasp [Brachionus plicatilis]
MFGTPKKCAKCEKSVYPIEELKCLDKVRMQKYQREKFYFFLVQIWHKNCFRCSVCNSILNMKNYKGFDKQPYCFVHYPQQKPTVVSENPELLRIKENTKIQSNVKYHEDFEKSKGIYTVVADDPETRRILENSKIISQAKYHEEFERNKKRPIQPVENTEKTQINEKASNGHGLIATFKSGENLTMENSSRKIGHISDYDPLSNEIHVKNPSNQTKAGVFSTSNLYQPQAKIQTYTSLSNIIYQNGSNGSINGSYQNGHSCNHLNGNGHLLVQTNSMIDIDAFNKDIKTTVYKAIYDYDAKEDDEISFRDGDKFINCEQIDIGWMIGVHEKTGKHGMFPANYAEPIDYF